MRCEGRPNQECPVQGDKVVRSCQGDMWLCRACEIFRFPETVRSGDASRCSRTETTNAGISRPTTTSTTSTAASTTTSTTTSTSTSTVNHHIPVENMKVLLPPLSGSVGSSHQEQGKHHRANTAKKPVSVDPYYINECLFFIQNRMETMTQDSLIATCLSFYKSEQIMDAKSLLYDTVKTRQKIVQRRGENKDSSNIVDILNVFRETEIEHTPRYLAQDINSLPNSLPNLYSDTANHRIDLESRENSVEIQELKSEMLYMFGQLQKQISSMQSENHHAGRSQVGENVSVSVQTSDETYVSVSVQTNDETQDVDLDGYEQQHLDSSIICVSDDGQLDHQQDNDDENTGPLSSNSNSNGMYEKHSKVRSCTYYSSNSQRATYSDALRSLPKRHIRSEGLHRQGANPYNKRGQAEREHSDVVIGSGKHNIKSSRVNFSRKCSGIFVSRLHESCTPGHVSSHVHKVTGTKVKVENLRTRRSGYTSFYVQCNQHVQEELLQASAWPENVLVKPFYS